MQLLDAISLEHQQRPRVIQLLAGDLSQLPAEFAVDVLVVSAFPDDYLPTHGSLIGALHRRGISVASLARDKEVDLRQYSSCWLSRPVTGADVHFRRILCFEHARRGSATELVGDIFRSIIPFTTIQPASAIAMPLVASGAQSESPVTMLKALVEAAIHWIEAGLPLDAIRIVIRDTALLPQLRETFAQIRARYGTDGGPPLGTARARTAWFAQRRFRATDEPEEEAEEPREDSEEPTPEPPPSASEAFRYDVFISYSQKNKDPVDLLVARLRALRPGLRIFMDRLELQPGAAWQQKIYEALDASRRVACLYSPDYLASKMCQEEFNIARLRDRESDERVLYPIFLFTAPLPPHIRVIQYHDVREADGAKIAEAAQALLEGLK